MEVASAKSTVHDLLRQAIWSGCMCIESGPSLLGRDHSIDRQRFSFDSNQPNSKETVTLAYSEVRELGICESLSSNSPQSTAEKTLAERARRTYRNA